MREMRIWLPNAAKCCKNAGNFFPDEERGEVEEGGVEISGVVLNFKNYILGA